MALHFQWIGADAAQMTMELTHSALLCETKEAWMSMSANLRKADIRKT
jgi:hypothetical protein